MSDKNDQATFDLLPINDPDSFGCCSRFRACSEAKKCVVSDKESSLHCNYRKKLESGIIYYGKNASAFKEEDYRLYNNRVDHLPEKSRAEYFKLLVFVHSTMMSTSPVVWDNSPDLQALADVHLCHVTDCATHLLDKYNLGKLRGRLRCNETYGPLWKAAIPVSGEKKNGAFMLKWLKENAKPFLSELAEKYRLVTLSQSMSRYSFEFFYDNLREKINEYDRNLPLLRNDDGLFKKGI